MAVGAAELAPSHVIREVGGILRRNWLAAAVPAALLGAGTDALVVIGHDLGAQLGTGFALAIAFELYVGYAERIVAADRSAAPRPGVATMARTAARLTPALVVASVLAVTVPLAATGLLVLPGLWLLTRWSLFAPAIVHEQLGPLAALRRSVELVRDASWAVAATATASVLVEHLVLEGTAHSAVPVLGSTLLALVVAAAATTVVSPPAAFTISVVYERRLHASGGTGSRQRPGDAVRRPASRAAALWRSS